MFKKLGFQKGLKNISVDSSSHIIFKKTNLKLVVLRPNDLAQLGDLIGQGNKDIITWIGKTVGRSIAEVTDQTDNPKDNMDFLNKALKNLEFIGFGLINVMNFDSASARIKVEHPIYEGLDENEDIISTIYLGIFLGIFEYLGFVGQGTESVAGWKTEGVNHSEYTITFTEVAQ